MTIEKATSTSAGSNQTYYAGNREAHTRSYRPGIIALGRFRLADRPGAFGAEHIGGYFMSPREPAVYPLQVNLGKGLDGVPGIGQLQPTLFRHRSFRYRCFRGAWRDAITVDTTNQ